jgi:hypothetical protein
MNNLIHNYLNQLRVISLFKEGDKARIENGFLTIDNKNWINWIKRQKWLYPWSVDIDSKEETVKHLQNFYISISQSIDQIVGEINNFIDTKYKTDYKTNYKTNDNNYDKLLVMSISLLDNIISSMKGLNNLSNTYKNYPRQYAEIKGIIDDYAKPTIQLLYKSIPKDKLIKLQSLNHELDNDIFKDENQILEQNLNNPNNSKKSNNTNNPNNINIILNETDIILNETDIIQKLKETHIN